MTGPCTCDGRLAKIGPHSFICRSCRQRFRDDGVLAEGWLRLVDAATDFPPEWIPDRQHCLPDCNRLDGHDGRDAGACMKDGIVLVSEYRHPGIGAWDFPGLVAYLRSRGYVLNPCATTCPDHGDPGHAHLRTPDGEDVIAWADGRISYYDLTQPARLIYPSPKSVRPYDLVLPRWPDSARGSKCYSLPSGTTVHVKPDCRC